MRLTQSLALYAALALAARVPGAGDDPKPGNPYHSAAGE
jgi:hypothetical protein